MKGFETGHAGQMRCVSRSRTRIAREMVFMTFGQMSGNYCARARKRTGDRAGACQTAGESRRRSRLFPCLSAPCSPRSDSWLEHQPTCCWTNKHTEVSPSVFGQTWTEHLDTGNVLSFAVVKFSPRSDDEDTKRGLESSIAGASAYVQLVKQTPIFMSSPLPHSFPPSRFRAMVHIDTVLSIFL